jgi:hypothetical protein
VIQAAFQQNPDMIGWFLLSNGTLAALTYNQEQEVIAWHRHGLGGSSASVESIAVIPSSTGTEDVLYMVVSRLINGATLRSIEYLTPQFVPATAATTSRLGQTFFDQCKVISKNQLTSGAVITGLDNLEGQTVGATIDGVYEATHVVASGSITLASTPVSEVVVGLPYTGTAKSLPLEGGSGHGSSQGMKKRLVEMKVRLWNSFNLNYGWASDLVAQDLTALTDVRSETSLPYFTGTMPLNPKNPHDIESPWTITQSKPYPLTVLAVVAVLETTQ